MYTSTLQATQMIPPTSSSQNMACQDCPSKVPGLDYAVPSNQSIMLRNYTPPEYPTVVYVPQRQCQPQYNNITLPQYQCADQPASSRFATGVAASAVRSSTPVYGRSTIVAQQEPSQANIVGCGCAQHTTSNQQQVISSTNTSNNQIPTQPGTYNYPSKKPCCYPENGTTNNSKYLQELEGQEFINHFPNKKYNRKKVNLEAVKEPRPRMTNKWVTEHRENFGFFSCSVPVNECGSTNDSVSATNSQQQLFVPITSQHQMIPPGLQTPIYNADYYQQGMPVTPTPATVGTDDYQEVFETNEDTMSATPVTSYRPKSPSHKKKQQAVKKEQPRKEVTKVEPPQLNESLERRSRGAYSDDNGQKEKKKTKQELYAEVYNKTLNKIQQKETNQKKKLIDRQEQYYNRLAVEEKQTLERNQRELQSYMNRGEKPPFFPYGHSNVTPVSDKQYMSTFNIAPRDPNQIAKDVVARREKTAEYDGWKKLLDEQDFKQWKPKSFYWKSFDRFDKYNNETKRERNPYGAGNSDPDEKIDSTPTTNPTSSKKKSSKLRKEEKKTAFVEPPAADSSDEEKENNRQYNEQPIMNQNADMKTRNSDYYSPEEYQMMLSNQQQYPTNYPTQPYQGNYPVGSNNVQYVYADQVQANNNTSTMAGQSTMINCESRRPNYEGPLSSDLKGLQFAKFIPKDYSDFNPKNYKALPIHYLNYIRPAGKVTPSNDAISECFRFYD